MGPERLVTNSRRICQLLALKRETRRSQAGPEGLADAEQLVLRGARDREALGGGDGADEVVGADHLAIGVGVFGARQWFS